MRKRKRCYAYGMNRFASIAKRLLITAVIIGTLHYGALGVASAQTDPTTAAPAVSATEQPPVDSSSDAAATSDSLGGSVVQYWWLIAAAICGALFLGFMVAFIVYRLRLQESRYHNQKY
jgi:hypothetical protein